MRSRFFVFGVSGLLGLIFTLSAQETERIYTGQIVKLDAKNKTITINGPREGLIPDQSESSADRGGRAGRGGGGGGAGGRGGRGAGGGGRGGRGSGMPASGPTSMRGMDRADTKIVWTGDTRVESVKDEKLTVGDLRVGDYVLINASKDGKKLQA